MPNQIHSASLTRAELIPVEFSPSEGAAVLTAHAPHRVARSAAAGLLLLQADAQRQDHLVEALWGEQRSD